MTGVQTCALPISGYEHNVAKIVRTYFASHTDEVRQDRLGNVVFYKKGSGENRPRILLAAHMDEIGLMVTKIEEGGFLRFAPVGGIDPRTIVGQEVLLYGKETLAGIIGVKPPHLTDNDDVTKAHKMEDLHIDVAMSEDRVKKLISVGDLAIIQIGRASCRERV